MKKENKKSLLIVLLLVLLAIIFPFLKPNRILVPFVTSSNALNSAVIQAKKTKKDIFVIFWANSNNDSKKSVQEISSDTEIGKYLNQFVLVKLNYDDDPSLANNTFTVRTLPAYFVLKVDNYDLLVSKMHEGVLSKPQLLEFLNSKK